jgi:predicted Zn-dependent protease
MEFRNPKVPEGINVSRHNPLADLALLSGGVLAGFVVLAVALIYLGGALARYVPVSWEAALARGLFDEADAELGGDPAVRGALQDLAGRLSERMDLPDGMTVAINYLDEDAVNAFATFGGHLFVFRGLIERMPDENALAMVLAHEIAHAANRDPAVRMGGGLLLQLALSVVLGSAPETLETVLLGPNALLMLGFGREAEARADADALGAVAALYGHVAGAAAIFGIFLEIAAESGRDEPPEILSSHPLNRERIAAIEARARAEGWPLDGDSTPLPPVLAALRDLWYKTAP